jgi:hypothetical protein
VAGLGGAHMRRLPGAGAGNPERARSADAPHSLVRPLLISAIAVFALSAAVSTVFPSTAQAQGPFSGIDPDPDHDGVLYPNDACPGHAGPAEGVGCPLEDLDGDGLASNQDLCPTVAGPEEGCPRPGETPARDNALEADGIAAGAMTLDRRGGLSLEGWFSPRPHARHSRRGP